MSPRNVGRLIALAIVLAVLGILEFTTKHNGRTTFTPANVSINPGKGWRSIEMPADPPACSPQLSSRDGIINAVVLDSDVTDLQGAVDKLQAAFAANDQAVKDSFKQEPFTTDSGLAGIHISYSAHSAKDGPADVHTHSFVSHNMYKRFFSISYITSPETESPAVIQAIQKSMRVE